MNIYRKFAYGLNKVSRVVGKVELAIISAIMAILTIVMFWQVLTRYFIGIPATWAEELCRYLFIWASYIGSAYAIYSCDHIEIDIINNLFNSKFRNPQKALAILKKIILIVITVFCIYFFDIYYAYVAQIAQLKQYSGAMEINMVYPMASGVVGLALMVFHAVCQLLMPIEDTMGDEEVNA